MGRLGPIAYIGIYALVVIAMLPAWPLTIAAGALFGFRVGVVTAFAGVVVGSSVAFLIARHGARGLIVRRFGRSPRFAALDLAINSEGRRVVFLLRLSPLVPFNLINYLLGLTNLRFRDYLVASVGMTPVTICTPTPASWRGRRSRCRGRPGFRRTRLIARSSRAA